MNKTEMEKVLCVCTLSRERDNVTDKHDCGCYE